MILAGLASPPPPQLGGISTRQLPSRGGRQDSQTDHLGQRGRRRQHRYRRCPTRHPAVQELARPSHEAVTSILSLRTPDQGSPTHHAREISPPPDVARQHHTWPRTDGPSIRGHTPLKVGEGPESDGQLPQQMGQDRLRCGSEAIPPIPNQDRWIRPPHSPQQEVPEEIHSSESAHGTSFYIGRHSHRPRPTSDSAQDSRVRATTLAHTQRQPNHPRYP